MFNSLFLEDKIFRIVANMYNYFYIHKKSTVNIQLSGCKNKIVVFTIVFNSGDLLVEQLKSVKKYFSKNMELVVVDNSSDLEQRNIIKLICSDNIIKYVPLPFNKYSNGHPSYSHALALNWTINNLVSKNKIKKFGFIDSDLFPISKCKIKNILDKQDFYGLKQERENIWYIWPGFCFFSSEVSKFNFLPINGLDTGGGMYNAVYSRYKKNDLVFPKQTYMKVTKDIGNFRLANVEIFDGSWLHLMDGSKSYKDKLKFLKDIWL